jgi:hypothetical protein
LTTIGNTTVAQTQQCGHMLFSLVSLAKLWHGNGDARQGQCMAS